MEGKIRGFYLIFKNNTMVPWDRLLVAIGCNYNSQKVICFIETEVSGIKNLVLLIYLSALTSFLMFSFNLMFVHRSYLSSLGIL